ncbi:hypothetical protein RUM43_008964 [Polyplax serrata]|uniref:Uncharacterized protein n=1 Tax=Polyplax serrata TaxID=468196 RepID=A0AAN8NV67_POLSC
MELYLMLTKKEEWIDANSCLLSHTSLTQITKKDFALLPVRGQALSREKVTAGLGSYIVRMRGHRDTTRPSSVTVSSPPADTWEMFPCHSVTLVDVGAVRKGEFVVSGARHTVEGTSPLHTTNSFDP